MAGETIQGRWDAWTAECLPGDGARISRLAYQGRDLLTAAPAAFRAPTADCGRYETRPVYGYDDCFPTVDPCTHPLSRASLPDHGELCWLPWQVDEQPRGWRCRVESPLLGVAFTRVLEFAGSRLTWRFEVVNPARRPVTFQHVMHPLMPLDAVHYVSLPAFGEAFDEIRRSPAPWRAPEEVAAFLLARPPGTASMLLLRNVESPVVAIRFAHGIRLRVRFPSDRFETLGIWWNRDGYPDEDGCRRNECAFEPIPGPTSSLADACAAGRGLVAPADSSLSWTITWEMTPTRKDP